MIKLVKDLYQYRQLLSTNIKKEIRGKYKGAWLGVIWSFLNPLLMLLIYAIVFPYILRIQVENYPIYLMVALIPWNFFTTTIQMGCGSIVANGNILKKVYFPREIIPMSVVTSGLINFLITSVLMFIFVFFSGIGLSWSLLYFPLIVLIQYVLMLGITLILSAITVFVRDVDHFVGVFLLMMFYITPIIYNPEMLPEKFSWVLKLNPMAYLVSEYRAVLYYKQAPYVNNIIIISVVSLIFFALGLLIFRKLEKNFAEEL